MYLIHNLYLIPYSPSIGVEECLLSLTLGSLSVPEDKIASAFTVQCQISKDLLGAPPTQIGLSDNMVVHLNIISHGDKQWIVALATDKDDTELADTVKKRILSVIDNYKTQLVSRNRETIINQLTTQIVGELSQINCPHKVMLHGKTFCNIDQKIRGNTNCSILNMKECEEKILQSKTEKDNLINKVLKKTAGIL
jgi:hypothetical protein